MIWYAQLNLTGIYILEASKKMNGKVFGVFLGGVAVGATITYIFLSRKFNAALTDKVNEETDENFEKESKKKVKPAGDWTNDPFGGEEKEDENKDSEDENDTEGDHEEMMAEKERPNDGEMTEPFVISEEQFSEEHPEFTKSTLIYYARDGVIAEEDDSLLDDQLGAVGDDWITKIDKQHPVIFVRNPKLGIDYEIDWDSRSYAVDIMGMDEDEV